MEPTFVVGTEQEKGMLKSMGFKAVVLEDADALAVHLEAIGSSAIIMLDEWSADGLVEACEAAGAVYRAVPEYEFADFMVEAFDEISEDGESHRAIRNLCGRERDRAIDQYEADRMAAVEPMLESLGVHAVMDVVVDISSGGADRERIPTGLANLDEILGGGVPLGGLVTIGAVSSVGKTTLCLQVADHIAASGRPVLFVTIEQGRHELVAKSISRIMRKLPTRNGGWYSASSADIRSKVTRDEWGEPMSRAFSTACTNYARTIAPNMRILETDEQPTVKGIRKAAGAMTRQRGTAPVIVVDYLQLLKPANDRMTERQAVDSNVMALRHIARDYGTCVILISSLNRASYSEGVTLEAFKESGAIEYGSDVLLGLQPFRMEKELAGITKEADQKKVARSIMGDFKSRSDRDVEVKVLKNREGAVPREGAHLVYHARTNLFEDAGSAVNDERDQLPRL